MLIDGSEISYTGAEYGPQWMAKHISNRESRAVAEGVTYFAETIRQRRLQIWVDNTSSRSVSRKMYSKSFELNTRAAEIDDAIQFAQPLSYSVNYVNTKANCSDIPSRAPETGQFTDSDTAKQLVQLASQSTLPVLG